MSGNKLLLILCIGVTYLFAQELVCATVRTVTQPIGTLVRIWDTAGTPPFDPPQPPPPFHQPYPLPTTPIGEVNYICAQWDNEETTETAPFDINYPATEIILTQPQHFVRLLGSSTSGSNGAWIMRSEYVRGRTPAELADFFALPSGPVEIVNVEMPASPDPVTGKDYALWTGIAGAIRGPGHDWGNGGAVQNRLIADPPFSTNYFPNYRYTGADTRNHRQPIGAVALSYKPLAGPSTSTTGRVAAYLDTSIPVAYSDLETVYNSLDYLNYIYYGPVPLQDALQQISAQVFDALSYQALRDSVLFGNAILERQLFRQWEYLLLGRCTDACDYTCPHFRIEAIGEFQQRFQKSCYNHVHGQTGGLVLSCDVKADDKIVCGVALSGFGNHLRLQHGGRVKGGDVEAGVYLSYTPSCYFIDGFVSGGYHWSSTSRAINFDTINRCAHSHQKGGDFGLHVQGGLTSLEHIIPLVRFSYLFNNHQSFSECGADSLNLWVNSFNTHTLRTMLGFELNTVVDNCSEVTLMPQLNAAWVAEIPLDHRRISSQLADIGSAYTVYGLRGNHSYFSGGAALTALFSKCRALYLRYDADVTAHTAAQAIKLGIELLF